MTKQKFNWDFIADQYIKKGRDMYAFSVESTGKDTDPKYETIKARCARERWTSQRNQFVLDCVAKQEGGQQALDDSVHLSYKEQRERLTDSDATILKHLSVAAEIQLLVKNSIPAIKRAMNLIDWDNLADTDPVNFIKSVQNLTNIMSVATEVERKALSLADYRIELTSRASVDIITKNEDLSLVSDKELIARYIESCKVIDV